LSLSDLREQRGDICEGSGRVAQFDHSVFADRIWTGLCAICGRQLELGYAGLIPEHTSQGPAGAARHPAG
jgi:hypothetical protein